MKGITVRRRTLPCPVCGRETLAGFTYELAERQVGYDRLFLPVPTRSGGEESEFIANNLTLFDNYLCPYDVFAYTGGAKITEAGAELDQNTFWQIGRFIRHDRDEHVGPRVHFLLCSLVANGLKATELLPANGGDAARAILGLIQLCNTKERDFGGIGKAFFDLREREEANPFVPLLDDFYQSRPFMAALMELQLNDLLHLVRRESDRRARWSPYDRFNDLLDNFRRGLAQDLAANPELVGNVLFQCLRLADYVAPERRAPLLRLAYGASEYLTRLNLRLGANLNRALHVVSSNADVLFYLHVRLARDLGIDAPNADAILSFVERRLNLMVEYEISGETPESIHTARIGRALRKYVPILKAPGRRSVA